MSATELFENAMYWLREHYGEYRFFAERDIVWTVQTQIQVTIEDAHLPYRVFNDLTISKGVRDDLAILDADDSIEVVVEFKYEPSHSRSTRRGGDIWSTKLNPSVVWWTSQKKDESTVAKDVQRARAYVEQGHARAGYSVFIDEGGEFSHRSPHPGSEWRDWGQGRWALWSQTSQREDGTPRAAVERSTEIASTVARGGGVTASWTPLPDWDPNLSELPVTLGFPDGSERKARQWNHLLGEVATWLWTTEHLTNDNLPVPSGPTNYIVNDTPYHSTGRKFDDPKEAEGTPLVVETDTGGRKETKRLAEKLLNHCAVEPRSILVKN